MNIPAGYRKFRVRYLKDSSEGNPRVIYSPSITNASQTVADIIGDSRKPFALTEPDVDNNLERWFRADKMGYARCMNTYTSGYGAHPVATAA